MRIVTVRPVAFVASVKQTPPCKKCKFFEKKTGACLLFFSQSPVEGSLVYFDAKQARLDERLCGSDGTLFKPLKK